MLINLRNALMTGKRLPYDAEVQYLESTGTQWINTGVNGAANLYYSLTIQPTYSSGDRKHFGSYPSKLTLAQLNGNWRFFEQNWILSSVAVDSTTASVVERRSNGLYVNGAKVADIWYGARASTGLILFGQRTDSGVSLSYCRVYACKIYLGAVLVRDLIPVRKGTVGYLYDRVSGKLFGNAGTGDFVVGSDVVPVEYIESHGTEWIDTGIRNVSCNSSFSFRITASFPSGISGTRYIGSGMSSPSTYQMFYALNSSSATRLYMSCNGATNIARQLSQDITSKHVASASVQNGTVAYEFDNESVGSFAFVTFTLPYLYLFTISGINGSISAIGNQRIFDFSFSADTKQIRAMTPVRVGTGSTWEGAMMDVLTRRIYRNAGTGAFAYGNDLKYPIPAE